ncbi:MAG: M48 family metallopeptidase [Candidatus Omnitrophica bacterium]|nr:M48 family metallopeptidase [Candidatus Omnitrophota bacterium]
MEIKIIRSNRRRRTVSARIVNDCLVISAPEALCEDNLRRIVSDFKLKFEKKKIKEELDRNQPLSEIADILNKKYFNNELKINSIEYVTGQNSKYGCCDYRNGHIRISHKVGLMPKWVRDYVLVHEMAHLIEPNHGKAFWGIVHRYRLTEKARGYLCAAGNYLR